MGFEWEGRFWSRVRKTDGCWEWIGCRTSRGYGRLSVDDVEQYTHRLSWLLHHGSDPGGAHVCHHCDNPACVRPEHLFLGDAFENMRDKERKGRGNHPPMLGERNGSSRILGPQLARIVELHRGGMPKRAIARELGVHDGTIGRVLRGQTSVSAALRKARGE